MKILIDTNSSGYGIMSTNDTDNYRREAAVSIGLMLNAASHLLQECDMTEDEALLFLEIALEGLKNHEPIDENDPRIQEFVNH